MGWLKTLDLLSFMLIQYILPAAAVPDLVMAIARHRLPLLTPLSAMGLTLSFWGMFMGLRRIQKHEAGMSTFFVPVLQTLRGSLYMLHWWLVIAGTTARISIRPKRLKWVKTVHQGTDEVWLDVPEQS
jgi:1,2-diacylglycerol 3-beta-glucosyltransferase